MRTPPFPKIWGRF